VEPRSALALCALCAAILAALGAYHGDGNADTRHMVPTMVLHRLGALLLIAGVVADLASRLPRARRSEGVTARTATL
jgi:cytochrome c oxidase assembly factor CtaG